MKALVFDLDGTLVDSVYAHVLAWQLAFADAGMPIEGWRLHRRMDMSGGLFKQFLPRPRPLPGAVQLFPFLLQKDHP
jgi:beta-phosphoglucomutase-like phosphatase (HAD superfamily)